MKAQPVPIVGALGFYGPNPGGERSPNMVREVRGVIIEVREIVTGEVRELTFEEWWSARAMCADTDRLVKNGNFDRSDLAARIRAMKTALACYARVFPKKPAAGEVVSGSIDSLGAFASVQPATAASDEKSDLFALGAVSLQQFANDFLMLPPLDSTPTTPLALTPLPTLNADGPVDFVLGELNFALPDLKMDSRHAQAA